VVQQIGWSAVGCITGGLALEAVADGHISIALGVVLIAIFSLIVSFVGLRGILVYERYAWCIYLVIFLVIFGMTGSHTDTAARATGSGPTVAGNVLSLLAIVYGSSASWVTIASDYYVLYPADTSRLKVFALTTLGVSLPTAVGMTAGCVVSFALNTEPGWAAAYGDGIGYLVQTILHPRGFAKLVLVLLVLSGVNCNIIALYSAAISCQQLSRPCGRVPRFVWTVLCFAVILVIAMIGRAHLNAYLQNFLSLLGYWCTRYGSSYS
jgi:purine-cytosine permease-like protein